MIHATREDGVKIQIDPKEIWGLRVTDKGCVVFLKDDPEPIPVLNSAKDLHMQAKALASFNPVGNSLKLMQGSLAQELNIEAKKTGMPMRWIPFPDKPLDVAMHLDEGIFMTRAELKRFKGKASKAILYKPGMAHEQNQQFDEDDIRAAKDAKLADQKKIFDAVSRSG